MTESEKLNQTAEADEAVPPAEAPGPPAEPRADARAEPRADAPAVSEVLRALEDFQNRFEQHLQDTAACSQSAFDRLYEEMRQYKNNFVLEVQRGLLLDVLMLHDNIDKLKSHCKEAGEIDLPTLVQNLEGLTVEAEEILARRGIDRLRTPVEKLDRQTQKAVGVVLTSDPEQHMVVAESRKRGFMLGDKAFRKEEVVVMKYVPPAASAEAGAADASSPTAAPDDPS